VSVVVTNAGETPGREVAQLYLEFPAAAGEPPLQLKGFVKTTLLAKGASATVRFALSDRSFSTWDVASHAWVVASGTFGVHVGASSRDIRLNATIAI
jgi:beta-glucosidase